MSIQPVVHSSAQTQSASTQSTTNNSANAGTGLQSIESTFLTLLVQELQNQDPTAPMDSTQMVGQMISLNQLDQLASINQAVTSALGPGSAIATGTSSNAAEDVGSAG